MIRAELVLDGIRDLATVASGPTPKVGELAGALGRVENAAIGIDGGRFVYVGPSRHLRRELRVRSGGRRIHLPEVSVVPGFVDAHTHLLFAGDRAQ
ncbi:MAG TPA: hypothetical protein VGS18_05105, partial [Thermoplasmata archaeon]|nr:hypothetical protein [Thermoplasmata archaeon]